MPGVVLGVALTLTACGGGSTTYTLTTATAAITNYTVGGTISGLTSGSVVLANGSATVTVAADASSWEFPTSFSPGSSYSVTVQTQPAEEQCAVTSGASGMDTGNVANVAVTCGYGQWTWKAGLSSANGSGVYGSEGTASAASAPGARYGAITWTDASGNFWLFGGVGYDSTGTAGYLNDLWQYSPSTGLWTWVSGGDGNDVGGLYGTQGTASATGVPGGRQAASSWTDASGNLWMFGGVGYAASGGVASLNDLWRYSPSSGQWTWVSGSETQNAAAVYGTEGTASSSNVPGARYSASSWIDASGNLWLFGGYGLDARGGVGELADLWKYTPASGQWTWVAGANTRDSSGVYGTEGTAASSNVPGARYSASTWIDASGSLWLFGGYGYDSAGSLGKLDDLWEYNAGSAEWTWVSGEDTVNALGVYGTLGAGSTGSVPGARQAAISWIDGSGNFWLFGGIGYGAVGGGTGSLNDLWQYSPSTKEWSWVSGSATNDAAGLYGTEDTGVPGDVPGARNAASAWIDASGKLWLFGGSGYDSVGAGGYLNDLWQYTAGS
ncbi:MAG TPA: kelch repeat-containing protein [Steroidobacteraceae bacterium]|nr:kelch repeat-containing protein [Steroidobacteraceae bacterium]